MSIEIHRQKPENFHPKVEAAVCYLEVNGRLLLLQLAPPKAEAGFWGVPGGKVEPNESPEQAAKRELLEETGIRIDSAQIQFLGSLYIRKPDIDYIYHFFKIHLDQIPIIYLSDEHLDYKWATSKEMKEMELMAGAKEALQHYRSALKKGKV